MKSKRYKNKDMGKNLRRAREARGMSVEELARACGMSPMGVEYAEDGGPISLSLRNAAYLADALQVRLDDIAGREKI